MILKVEIAKCFLCEKEWLPEKTEKNPTGDPRKVKRCTRCKSTRWNEDDPRVIVRNAKSGRAPKKIDREKNARTVKHAAAVDQAKHALRRTEEKRKKAMGKLFETPAKFIPLELQKVDAIPVKLCRHRLKIQACPLCKHS